MLHLQRATGELADHRFTDLPGKRGQPDLRYLFLGALQIRPIIEKNGSVQAVPFSSSSMSPFPPFSRKH
jgi:hypothetical protein